METNGQYFDCLCRTCMNKVEASSHDGNSKPQQQWLSILDIIEECGDLRIAELLSDAVPQIVVQPTDELPKKICRECLQQLLSVHRFQLMCVQSDKQMHELLSKEHTILKPPILKEVIKGETETIDADSEPLKDLPCSSTLQNLQQPSIQESLAEVIVPTIEPEAAESSPADHLQDNTQLLEHCNDSQGDFGAFIKNEPIEDDEPNSEYSDDNTMHSTISVNKDEPIELENERVNVTSSRHNCHLCNKSYKRREYLRRHLNAHKKKANNLKVYCYACHLCSESYKERRYLTKHLNLAHYNRSSYESKEKPHKCDLCEKRYTRIYELQIHKRKHTGEKPYKCKYCESAFNSSSTLMRHLTTHENEDPETRKRNLKALQEGDERQSKEEQQQQKLSNKELEQPSTVRDEFREFVKNEPIDNDGANAEYSDADPMQSTISVTNEKPTELKDEEVNVTSALHKCHLCKKSFQKKSNLRRHKRKAHSEEYCHACHLCSNTYTEEGYLTKHLLRAHSIKPQLTCHICNKSFKTALYLRRHKRTHAEKRAYSCSECGKSFHQQYKLTHHRKTHFAVKRHECSHCQQRFRFKSNLIRHIATHEEIRVHECDICGKRFKTKLDLTNHTKYHTGEKPHKCDICEQQFYSNRLLQVHIRTHTGEKPYQCKCCESRFISGTLLNQHLRSHLGKNIYRCEFCPLAFPSTVERRVHLHSHDNDDPETRARNLKALQEEEAKLKYSKKEIEKYSTEEQQQQEIEQPSTDQAEFTEFIQNETIEDEKSNTQYSDGGTMHSTISVKMEETSPIEPDDQQVNVTREEIREFIQNEPIEDEKSNTEYSDGDRMHSTMPVMKNEPTEPKDEQLNDASSHRHVDHEANSEENCHVCHLCSKSYTDEWILTMHLRKEHSIELNGYTCKFCSKNFKAPELLRRHIRIHTGERPYSCSDCGKTFNQKGSLGRHRYIHTGDKPHECPYCPLRYSTKVNAERHKLKHEGVKEHECDICGKSFTLKSDLKIHKLIHNEEKSHKCDICGQQFLLFYQLKVHMRKHTGEKPYKCKYCERAFIASSILSSHLRTHLGKNTYRCELCPLAFPLHSELRLHLTTHENEDPETREQNLKALQEEEAKLKLKWSKKETEKSSTEEQQQQKFSKMEIEQPSVE